MHLYSLCQTRLNLKTHTVSETQNRTSCLTTAVRQSQSVAVSQTLQKGGGGIKAEGVCRLFFRVCVRGRLLRRESSVCRWGGWVQGWDWNAERRFKMLREVGSLLGSLTAEGEIVFYCVRVGESSRYSQVLLLPLGVPLLPAPAMLHTKSFPIE